MNELNSFDVKRQDAVALIKKRHAGQVHANNVPVTHHLERVSERLQFLLQKHQEGSIEEREVIILSALGHDILEDTGATDDELKEIFGEHGLAFIKGMTNEWGDEDVTPYVKKVSSAKEEVRLIKLSDLLDNISAVSFNVAVLGVKWTTEYFLPVVTPMKNAVLETTFVKYKETSDELKNAIKAQFSILQNELKRFEN